MTYRPNFSDPRVQRRCAKALLFVEQFVNDQPRWLSQREIQRHFGNLARPLGHYLREQLLICTDDYFNMQTGQCKKYRRNRPGVAGIKQQLGFGNVVADLTADQHQQLDSGEFEYKDKSQRLWCDFQFMEKTLRDPLLKSKGYNWDYDIEAAAPTLLYQYSQQLYQKQWLVLNQTRRLRRCHKFSAVHIELLISDRTSIRQQIADQCGCSEDDVKKTINALFQGGVLTTYKDSKLFQDLGGNFRKISALKSNRFLCEIKKEIKQMWSIIKEELPVRYFTDKNGVTRRRSLRGGDKSGVYLGIEREIAEVVRGYLKQTNNKHLWIHDGWMCAKRVYSEELVRQVYRKTGYLIKLTEKVIEN